MKRITAFFALLSSLIFSTLNAQTYRADSLITALKTAREDTNKVNLLNALAYMLYTGKPDSTLLLAQQAITLSVKLNWKKGESGGYNNYGITCAVKGNYPKALDYFLKASKIDEETGSKASLASDMANVGITFGELGNYPKALSYFFKAIKIDEFLNNKNELANNYENVGTIYQEEADYHQSLEYLSRALQLDESIGNKQGEASILGNIGNDYESLANYPMALNYDMKALHLDEETGDKLNLAGTYGDIGIILTKTGKFKEAEEFLNKAIALDSGIGEQNDLRQFSEYLSYLYDTTGRYKLALEWYKKAMVLKDTLFNIDKDKALTRKELTFTFERQADSAKAAQDKKDAVAASNKKKQDVITASVSVGLMLVLAFSVVLFNRFRITQKQKRVIEKQKNMVEKRKEEVEHKNVLIENQKKLVEEKNKDILDSITYAKRLQDAILPPVSLVQKYFPESFVLYKPKDIVAGDFYWLERAGNSILVAACDCTGHGVPGALVSVVCSNALNRAVKEFHITEPGKILDKVRELVLETFDKSEGNIQDGMDISLASLSPSEGEILIQWSGAYNSLWYTIPTLGGERAEMIEIPGDKQPIWISDNPRPFTTHTLTLNPLSGIRGAVYLFTDGFADQFGGPNGKKFKYKQLLEKLLAISHQPLAEQKAELEKEFEQWKGSLEQTDYVCVIGIRI